MAVGQTSRTQVRAYKFATRQMEWALTQGDPLLHTDPGQLPRRWTLISFFLALLLLAGFSVYGLIRPAPDWRAASLLLETDSGTLYVNRSGVLHPALNLTSALLALGASGGSAGSRPTPLNVSRSDLADAPRGALMGIPGAPDQLPAADAVAPTQWSTCDQSTAASGGGSTPATITSTLMIGRPLPGSPLTDGQALLATAAAPAGGTPGPVYLVWAGHRARIDLADGVITEALRLQNQQPRQLSVGLLNALPEGAPIVVPTIPRDNEATLTFTVLAEGGTALPIGSVFRVQRVGGDTFHVVTSDGVAEITPTMADVLRFRHSLTSELPTVKPEMLAQQPVSATGFDSSILPAQVPELVPATREPMICAGWDAADPTTWTVSAAEGMPAGTPLVSLAGTSAQAQVSQVAIAPGSAAVVSESVPNQTAAQITKIYLVTDLGVAYPLADNTVLAQLGFSTPVASAPKVLVDLLPRGAVLDSASANRLWDSFPSEMLGGATSAPGSAGATAPIAEATLPLTIAPTS